MLSKRESELNADAITVVCFGCTDEYLIYVSWGDWSKVVERDKDCLCPLVDAVETEAIAVHFHPPESFYITPAPGMVDLDERIDREDDYVC